MNESKEKFTIHLNILQKYTSVGDFKDGVFNYLYSTQLMQSKKYPLFEVFNVEAIFNKDTFKEDIIRILNLEGEVLYELDSSNDTAFYLLLGLFGLLDGKTD